MDWSRSKTILILSFLLLNLVLGYQLFMNRSELLDLEATAGGAAEEIQRLLKAKNIEVPDDLPKDVPRLKDIVVRFDESMTAEQPTALKTSFKFNPLINKGAVRDAVARASIPQLDAYEYDPIVSTKDTHVFNQMYGDLPMFEVRLELLEQGGRITAYRQRYAEVQPESGQKAQKEQKVISPYVALRSLIEYYLPEGSVVTSIRLGYHGQEYNSQTMYMVPYWRVSLGSGEVYFVHAFNGAVE